MSRENKNKLKDLISQWPRGTVHTSSYLHAIGYGYDLLAKYKKNGWIIPIGRGAWRLAGDDVDWQGGIYALQQELILPVHIGGKTVLEEMGYGHYGVMGRRMCYLYGPLGTKLPRWFVGYDWSVDLQYAATNLFPSGLSDTFTNSSFEKIKIKTSTVERAVFEMLYFVPVRQGYDEAQKILAGLLTLRPKMLQLLLETCTSVKVKRLFMVMAEEAKMPWVEDIKLDKVNFGQGSRQLVRDGVWHKKYQITIPLTRDL